MVRKLPLSSVFYTINSGARDTPPSSPPPPAAAPPAWMWPSCKHPRADSFRSTSAATAAAAAKTIASIFLDSGESSFANSSARMMHHDCASDSLSTESEVSATAEDMADAIVRGLRSDRLLFEPRAPSSSILDKKPLRRSATDDAASFGGGVAVAFDSEDPYEDFRASMAEMLAAHGVGDWDWLEAMLGWYLRANGKETHAAIVAAFVDLVVSMAASGSSSSRHSSFTLAGTDLESSSAGGAGNISFRLR
ncbi:transcription repressor OFP13-like [Oryza brachyantha]|uniref:Transcription repressor n=1 Tax=Oryza brachyantha TaxID=4533 RepID=J3M7M1_ORYBR|nr:transcription repressor OFP13-like [Oryza brachyantha]